FRPAQGNPGSIALGLPRRRHTRPAPQCRLTRYYSAYPACTSPMTRGQIMNDYRQHVPAQGYGAESQLARNRVLRNTYWLLALSMVPTVLGAMVGLYSGVNQF